MARKQHEVSVGWIWMFLVLAVFIGACSALPDGVRAPESPLLAALERKSGLIAFLGTDGNLYTIDQGGGYLKAVTSDADLTGETGMLQVYQQFAWSPKSDKLAFVGVHAGQEGTQASLFVTNPDGSGRVETFASSVEFPFYLYWAPDNQLVSFLTSMEQTNILFLRTASASGGTDSAVIDTGGPYYWNWEPNGERLLTHTGGSVALNPGAQIRLVTPGENQAKDLKLKPVEFRAPAWSPNGEELLLAVEDSGAQSLVVARIEELPVARKLAEIENSVAFNWSPDGKRVAYISSQDTQNFFGPVIVVDRENPENVVSTGDQYALAYFWAPDSRKIAYLIPAVVPSSNASEENATELVFGLFVMDVRNGKTWSVFNFVPTPQFTQIIPFFDQYAHSATIWSPDSDNLVVAARYGEAQAGIFMLAASGRLDPRYLADGLMAFWSWK